MAEWQFAFEIEGSRYGAKLELPDGYDAASVSEALGEIVERTLLYKHFKVEQILDKEW